MSEQQQPDPNELVRVYGRMRRQDKEWLEAWADERGITFAIALSLASTPGIEYLRTWGVTG